MPAEHLLAQFQDDVQLEEQWRLSGMHYARTCEAWLQNLDRDTSQLLETLEHSTSDTTPQIQLQRWRMFFMACAELFRYHDGSEWFVGHYRFRRVD